ncbi:MAG TPA: metallophosphoesterase [Thermoanaerobaculia bacterium]|nr:metallophosphoesterase [Thermoanaerobaculia bacterium]
MARGRTLTWLHLSDIHRCSPRDGAGGHLVLQRLREDLEQLLATSGLRIDLIFMTGDLAFGHVPQLSLQDQFLEGWMWLDDLRSAQSAPIPAENVFLVPGNHDVDRSRVLDKDQDWLRSLAGTYDAGKVKVRKLLQDAGEEWQHFMARFQDYKTFIEEFYPHLAEDSSRLLYAVTREISGLKVGIAGFNSAWSCGSDGEKSKLWLGGEWQLETLAAGCTGMDLRIALVHHPFNWLVEEEDPHLKPRFQSEFHVLLHGHEHQQWVEQPQPDHLQIAAGASMDRPGADLGYNLVTFDLDAGKGEVWLRTFDHRTGRWKEDSVPGRTDNRGVWPLDKLPWVNATRQLRTAAPEPTVAIEKRPNSLTGSESRGVFGRDSDIRRLRQQLGKTPVVVAYGLSGIGKTLLIEEVSQAMGHEHKSVRLMPAMGFNELYSRLAHELGCREPDPQPMGLGGMVNFAPLGTWTKNLPGPRLLHLEGGHHLFEGKRDPNTVRLFEAIATQAPRVCLVVESAVTPPSDFLPGANRFRVKGIPASCLRQYFRRPLRGRPELGWELGEDELSAVAAHLSSQSQAADDVHPMALFLLVTIAVELGLSPPEVFNLYHDRLQQTLDEGLFGILYEKVLNGREQRMLRACALYREGVVIPKSHVAHLSDRVGDNKAFAGLVRRLILERQGEDYLLHNLLREFAQRRLSGRSDEVMDDHGYIAGAWLESVRYGRRFGIPDIMASNEAFHHLREAQDYGKLAELEARHLRHDTLEHLERITLELKSRGEDRSLKVALELWLGIESNPKAHRFLAETIERIEGKGANQALFHYRQALAATPDYPHTLVSFGSCLLARGEGLELCERLEALEAATLRRILENHHLISVYVRALEQAGRGGEASRLRRERIDAGTRNAALFQDEARALREARKPDEALEVLDRAIELGIADDFTLSLRGLVLVDVRKAAISDGLPESKPDGNVPPTAEAN